jgi:hypothetical protein
MSALPDDTVSVRRYDLHHALIVMSDYVSWQRASSPLERFRYRRRRNDRVPEWRDEFNEAFRRLVEVCWEDPDDTFASDGRSG